MKIEIVTIIESAQHWDHKKYSVILVNDPRHIEKVYRALVRQDKYWRDRDYRKLIRVKPEKINSVYDIEAMCEYCGKTDIFHVLNFAAFLKETEGIDIFIFQYQRFPFL